MQQRIELRTKATGRRGDDFRIWVEPHKETGKNGFFVPIVDYKREELRELYLIPGIKNKWTRPFSRERSRL